MRTTPGEILDFISTTKTFYENFCKEKLTLTETIFPATIKQNEISSFS